MRNFISKVLEWLAARLLYLSIKISPMRPGETRGIVFEDVTIEAKLGLTPRSGIHV